VIVLVVMVVAVTHEGCSRGQEQMTAPNLLEAAQRQVSAG